MSRGVSLNKVPMADEPIPDPIPQAAPAPLSTAVARKLINPKYALVATGTQESVTSSDQNSSNKNSRNPTGLKLMKGPHRIVEEPHIHPALVNMERAYLIPYLPTWPDPDPPSDVIGFINIRDEKRAHQVHLQRSERFEVSQAIRFSSPLMLPAETQNPAPPVNAKGAEATEKPSGNISTNTFSPVSPTKKQPKQLETAQNKDQKYQTDSRVSPQEPDTQDRQDTQPPTPSSTVAQQPADPPQQAPETQTEAAPVPKRRTLQLVINPGPSEQTCQPQVTLMKMDTFESQDDFSDKEEQQELTPTRARMMSRSSAQDSGSNDEGSQDSTKVICDRAAIDDPSSTSTASEEEFYDCPVPEPRDPLTNGVTTGSGRGHRQGDRGNVMARLSQSMLDLREPTQTEDSAALIRQLQQLRRQANPSPHRHIGQVSMQQKTESAFLILGCY